MFILIAAIMTAVLLIVNATNNYTMLLLFAPICFVGVLQCCVELRDAIRSREEAPGFFDDDQEI